MKKNKVLRESAISAQFFKKMFRSLLVYALILPLALKCLVDIPVSIGDYICNSYAGIYPTATAAGLVMTQILTVLAEMLRAGFIGSVLCIVLYLIARGAGRRQMILSFLLTLVSPLLISFVGMLLNYWCVKVGLSRDTVTIFKLKLPQLKAAMFLEYFTYAALLVLSALIMCIALMVYRNASRSRDLLFEDKGGFFPSAPIYRLLTLAIGFFGLVSLAMTVSDMMLDLSNYYNITESLSGIMGYLVLPYLYLVMKLFAMMFCSAVVLRRLNKMWQECEEKDA